MGPDKPLPYSDDFPSAEEYVESLLDLVENHDLFRTLCGGVHVLDFFTSDPPLYSRILPLEWREFFAQHDIMDLLDLFHREDLESVRRSGSAPWRNGPCPPRSLVDYIDAVRKHLLDRVPNMSQCAQNRTQKKVSRSLTIGMKVKKIHEVALFSSYIDNLATEVSSLLPSNQAISHLADFGSGQSYLGRVLASEPYNRHVVAIESKTHNAERAKKLDVKAKLVEKQKVLRNKKAFRAGLVPPDGEDGPAALPTPPPEPSEPQANNPPNDHVEKPETGRGTIQHVSHRIHSGDLSDIISSIHSSQPKNLIVMSLHSCGNLVHHGLRALTLNPSVKAVAMVGCCYNLITERLGPATFKLPGLRPTSYAHPRIEREGAKCDPDGFPMSTRFCTYGDDGKGVRLNVTARVLAVQAPARWSEIESAGFFQKHYFRALLQQIFLDRGVIGPPDRAHAGGSPIGHSSGGTPILIGGLRGSCYDSFVTYVRGALDKLNESSGWGNATQAAKMSGLSDADIEAYAKSYEARRQEMSVMWSLMAFSAGAIEAAIVVDRWSWLKEQEEVTEAWVESLFDYRLSPRNLVVVGVKKQG